MNPKLSTAEASFLKAWGEHGIPDSEPIHEWQGDIYGPSGRRRYRWDFAWPRCKILVEIQGCGRHHTIAGVAQDAEKARRGMAAGYTVVPITSKCLQTADRRRETMEQLADIIMSHGVWGE